MLDKFLTQFLFVLAWVELHPVFATLIVWPVVTGLLNFFFKPRTPEQYELIAKISPRLAALLQLIGAAGFDPVKTIATMKKLAQGAVEKRSSVKPPPTPPTGFPPVAMILVATMFGGALLTSTIGCTPKGVVNFFDLLMDKTRCALVNQDLPDDQIIAKCALNPEDVPKILAIVSESRKAAKAAAEKAAAEKSASCHATIDAGTEGGK